MDKTIRISKDNYKKPKEGTLQDSLQNTDSVKEKLEGYIEVSSDELCYLPQNTSIRYITKKGNEYLFRLGGNLHLNKPDYIVLKSINNVTWCVQKKNTMFYRALTKDEKYSGILDQQNDLIEEQQNEINYLKEQLKNNN